MTFEKTKFVGLHTGCKYTKNVKTSRKAEPDISFDQAISGRVGAYTQRHAMGTF
jgi:hypothetical protein